MPWELIIQPLWPKDLRLHRTILLDSMGPCGPHCELKVRQCWEGLHLTSLNKDTEEHLGSLLLPFQPSRKKETKPFLRMLNSFLFCEFYQIHWVQKSHTAYAVDSQWQEYEWDFGKTKAQMACSKL